MARTKTSKGGVWVKNGAEIFRSVHEVVVVVRCWWPASGGGKREEVRDLKPLRIPGTRPERVHGKRPYPRAIESSTGVIRLPDET